MRMTTYTTSNILYCIRGMPLTLYSIVCVDRMSACCCKKTTILVCICIVCLIIPLNHDDNHYHLHSIMIVEVVGINE
jgi:hypothetical protein